MSDYDFLPVSNGSGDAALMHIQTLRTAGSTTIDVDTVVNVPAKFIGTSGTLLPSGYIDPATKKDMKCHVSGADIIIDGFLPGSTDTGNTAGQVLIIKPNSYWSDLVAQFVLGAYATIYPIGCVYTETTGVNPNTTFGFGTWAAFGAGRVLVGSGTSDQVFTAGATGGESNHVLSTTEMPSHTHLQNAHNHQENFASAGGGGLTGITGTASLNGNSGASQDTAFVTAVNLNTGGGVAHNNLQPYTVVYFWKRTA